jgi:4'-phosphopantetheinyl transferase
MPSAERGTNPEPNAPIRVVAGPAMPPGAPAADEVRVLVVPLDAPPAHYAELFEYLTDDERTRAARYKVEPPRRQFVIGRGLLRRLLANCLGLPAREVPISYNGAGKPLLADSAAGLHFNVTHTDGLALIALSRRAVGIDVERVRRVENPEGLVGRFFSAAERAAYLGLAEQLRPAGFFRGWTSKEAVIKAAGLSVAYLDEFDVELNPARPAAVLAARHPELRAGVWGLAAWEAATGFAAAVAVEGAAVLRITTAGEPGQS